MNLILFKETKTDGFGIYPFNKFGTLIGQSQDENFILTVKVKTRDFSRDTLTIHGYYYNDKLKAERIRKGSM